MNVKAIVTNMAHDIINHESELTTLDRKIGDADHGNNMTLGFQEVLRVLNKFSNHANGIFNMVGQTLMSKVGGASGPLYGMSFVAGSKALGTNAFMTFKEFKGFVKEGLNSIMALGGAKPGDKTMVDVWYPLNELMKSLDLLDKQQIIKQIEEFKNETKDMKALKGRASYLGERSIGTIDPGSLSSLLILKNIIAGING